MCRWIAYAGRPVFLEQLLLHPERSLIDQSLHARKSMSVTNGDGFGVGWYGARREPGLYREDRPAWNDDNLKSLAAQIAAPLVFAHVRASTGTSSSRANCHPFRQGRWLFMHNGQIGGFDALARDLDFALAPSLYRARQGDTDSETLFLLAMTFGLQDDPLGALARATGYVQQVMREHAVTDPLRLTAALTDGERIFAVRWSSDHASPTLFHAPAGAVRDAQGRCCVPLDVAGDELACLGHDPQPALGNCAWILASEPLDGARDHWTAVPEGHCAIIERDAIAVRPWAPAAPAAGLAAMHAAPLAS